MTKKRFFIAFFSGAFFLALPVLADDTADEQTITAALAYVCAHNPTLLAAQAELRGTDELYPQATAGWRPTVSAQTGVFHERINSDDPIDEGTGATTKNITLDVDQPLYRGGRTSAETARARHLILAERARYQQTEEDLLLKAVTAYMDVMRDQTLLYLNQNNAARLTREMAATQERFAGGDVTSTDVQQSQSRLLRAQADEVAAQGDLNTSLAAFEDAVGFPALPSTTLNMPDINFALPATLDEALQQAEGNNPGLQAAQNRRAAAGNDIDATFSDLLPQVSAFASYDQEYQPQPGLTDHAGTGSFGVRARVALYEAGLTRSRVRTQKDTAWQRDQEVNITRQAIREETTRNWHALIAARNEVTARVGEMQAAQTARDGVSEEARLGARTVLDVLDADQELLNAQAAMARARRNQVVFSYALAASLGLLLPEKMAMTAVAYDPAPHLQAVRDKVLSLNPD